MLKRELYDPTDSHMGSLMPNVYFRRLLGLADVTGKGPHDGTSFLLKRSRRGGSVAKRPLHRCETVNSVLRTNARKAGCAGLLSLSPLSLPPVFSSFPFPSAFFLLSPLPSLSSSLPFFLHFIFLISFIYVRRGGHTVECTWTVCFPELGPSFRLPAYEFLGSSQACQAW